MLFPLFYRSLIKKLIIRELFIVCFRSRFELHPSCSGAIHSRLRGSRTARSRPGFESGPGIQACGPVSTLPRLALSSGWFLSCSASPPPPSLGQGIENAVIWTPGASWPRRQALDRQGDHHRPSMGSGGTEGRSRSPGLLGGDRLPPPPRPEAEARSPARPT